MFIILHKDPFKNLFQEIEIQEKTSNEIVDSCKQILSSNLNKVSKKTEELIIDYINKINHLIKKEIKEKDIVLKESSKISENHVKLLDILYKSNPHTFKEYEGFLQNLDEQKKSLKTF